MPATGRVGMHTGAHGWCQPFRERKSQKQNSQQRRWILLSMHQPWHRSKETSRGWFPQTIASVSKFPKVLLQKVQTTPNHTFCNRDQTPSHSLRKLAPDVYFMGWSQCISQQVFWDSSWYSSRRTPGADMRLDNATRLLKDASIYIITWGFFCPNPQSKDKRGQQFTEKHTKLFKKNCSHHFSLSNLQRLFFFWMGIKFLLQILAIQREWKMLSLSTSWRCLPDWSTVWRNWALLILCNGKLHFSWNTRAVQQNFGTSFLVRAESLRNEKHCLK